MAAGLGTLARVVAENKPIYRERLCLADARMRIEGIYKPYHATLQKLLTDTATQFGVAVLIDCHSMPRLSRSGDRTPPDIVLGDRYGTTCAPVLMDLAETVFAGVRAAALPAIGPMPAGTSPAPMAGPHYGIHALQIEISRNLYMNEVTLDRHEGFNAVKAVVERLIAALIALETIGIATQPMAAE